MLAECQKELLIVLLILSQSCEQWHSYSSLRWSVNPDPNLPPETCPQQSQGKNSQWNKAHMVLILKVPAANAALVMWSCLKPSN